MTTMLSRGAIASRWRSSYGLALPVAGPWQVTVEVLVDDFEGTNLEGSVTVRP